MRRSGVSSFQITVVEISVSRLRFRPFQSPARNASRGPKWVDRGSTKTEIDLICLAIATREAQGAAACSGSDCDVDNVVLGVGDPRASAGPDGLPGASRLVSARLGIDGALSVRHLSLWILLLSGGLFRLSGGLPVWAGARSRRTAGPSPTVSASGLVVVMKISSLGLPESFRYRLERKSLPTLILLAVVLAPLLVASLFWGLYRHQTSSAAPAKAVTSDQSPSSPKSQQIAAIDETLSNAGRAIMFSMAPLTSLSAVITPVDPDPVASFRQLIALPPGSTREPPRIDPRKVRAIVDRGVVEYASARTDGDRARGARLIQTAALVGYPPARNLLARNYPQSEAVRSVVPAMDVIRYALGPVMDVAATSEDSKQIFLALGQQFALQGELDLFASQVLDSLRGDSRPQLIHRVDTLLDLLARVPGACGALARLLPGADKAADQECLFSENLRKVIETARPSTAQEEESKRRGLLMLNELGER